ncbi:hypothetical protein GWI33_021274 [Rhynchophorus ferrugineus]|uniref:Uncharacterized protein n=1 Tax=Rhynchophorus ferrugineus TaxID=354439 RepID=A0A834HSU7_RHYFE|nr:hypothetical protein GWI33_021274 [Rhynchophorus ferrugineus]
MIVNCWKSADIEHGNGWAEEKRGRQEGGIQKKFDDDKWRVRDVVTRAMERIGNELTEKDQKNSNKVKGKEHRNMTAGLIGTMLMLCLVTLWPRDEMSKHSILTSRFTQELEIQKLGEIYYVPLTEDIIRF